MGVEILKMHMQIFNTVKACFFIKGIQQSGLITDQTNKRNSFLGQEF